MTAYGLDLSLSDLIIVLRYLPALFRPSRPLVLAGSRKVGFMDADAPVDAA
jgi:hypothetical protein